MKIALVTMLLFFHIYSMSFSFIPIAITTKSIYGIIGLFLFSLLFLKGKKVPINGRLLFFFLFTLLVSLLTIFVNQTSELFIIKYCISIIVIFFSSYFMIYIMNKLNIELSFKNISLLIINVIFIQSIIAMIMFTYPEIAIILNSFEKISETDISIVEAVSKFRITGFGARFFNAGVISGFGLILIGAMIRNYSLNLKNTVILSLKFLIIFIIGIMMARTTLIGGLLGLMLIFMPKDLKVTISISMFRKRIFFVGVIVIVSSVSMTILYFLVPKVGETLEPVFNFAFEIFINYFESGQLESESTNQLKNMYIFPESIKTWIIGDGFWNSPDGRGYYMHTDVGYLRMIYYFGIFGMIGFFLINYYSMLFKNTEKSRLIKYVFLLYLAILNLKGSADILSFTLLFLIYYTYFKNKDFLIWKK